MSVHKDQYSPLPDKCECLLVHLFWTVGWKKQDLFKAAILNIF